MALIAQTLPARRVSFKAGAKGDSVAAVAKRYRLSPAMVAQWNKVGPQAAFKAGQTVVVMLPAAAGPSKRASRPAPRTRVAQR
jgi:membrane-bound lytic murein transglycosylase D